MTQIERFPFAPDMEDAADAGMKACTARTKTYGRKGDTFVLRHKTYELIAVEKLPLAYVAKCLWYFEGFTSEQEFIDKWMKLHPIKGWMPTQEVYVHWFRPQYIDPTNWS